MSLYNFLNLRKTIKINTFFVVKLQQLPKMLFYNNFTKTIPLKYIKRPFIYEYINKEFNMNKLKKIGLTALGTSLVASSAIAADASLTGNVGYTWSSEEVGTSTTDGIGYEADFNMVVSGEMDNGWTATGSLLLTESATLSSSWTSLTMGSMGTIIVGNGYGGVGQAFDDVTPELTKKITTV